jgi:hypothetical protein
MRNAGLKATLLRLVVLKLFEATTLQHRSHFRAEPGSEQELLRAIYTT